jgi:hypothetical protein
MSLKKERKEPKEMNTTADEADRFFESCRLHLNDVLSAYICVNLRLDLIFFSSR